jgi:hypothetical protein
MNFPAVQVKPAAPPNPASVARVATQDALKAILDRLEQQLMKFVEPKK